MNFRGKRVDNGEWVEGYFVRHPSGFYIYPHDLEQSSCEVIPETVGQYTGLNDKNRKEIYEGDVLSMDSWEPKNVQIRFIEGAFCLANKQGEYIGDIHYIHHAGRPQSTVIGNIYEDIELLPSKKTV